MVNVDSFTFRTDSEKHSDFALDSPFGKGRPGRVNRKLERNKANKGDNGDNEDEEEK